MSKYMTYSFLQKLLKSTMKIWTPYEGVHYIPYLFQNVLQKTINSANDYISTHGKNHQVSNQNFINIKQKVYFWWWDTPKRIYIPLIILRVYITKHGTGKSVGPWDLNM
jgi:hypothetical protein